MIGNANFWKELLKVLGKEATKIANKRDLNKIRGTIKRDFPGVNFRETLEFMEQLKRGKHRCNTCNRYTKQTDIATIDAKFKKHPEIHDTSYFFRLFDNPNEKLEDSKGYCITSVTSGHEKVKTIINTPDKSVCTEWTLHLDIQRYFGYITKKLVKERDLKLAQEKIDSQEKIEFEKAKKIVDDYNSRTIKRGRGRPSTDPSKKTYFEE